MGVWKRRIAEKVRQNYGVTIDRGFKPTSNARLSATFAETKRFADALRKFDKQCSAHLREVKDFHRQSQQFMSIQVPRMHTETRPGEATPAEPESIVGAQVKFERITESGVSGGDKIYQYVQEPLRKWLANFDAVVIQVQAVEQLRLTLDSRRRSVSTIEGDITNLQARTNNPEDPRLIKCVQRKHRQEAKMQQVQDDFHAKEVATYQNMRHLVNDVKYVQQHILKLFDLLRQINGDVCDAFLFDGIAVADNNSGYVSQPESGYLLPPAGSDSELIQAHGSGMHPGMAVEAGI